MHLAPNIPFSVSSRYVAPGLRGIRQTVGVMRAMVQDYRTDPVIRRAAVDAIFNAPEKGELAEARAVFALVRDSIRYVRDVHEVETLQSPVVTLLSRIGDCDDQSTLLAALLESVGYPTRFVVAGYSVPGELEHVYLQALIDGAWCDMDPTEHEYVGWQPPGPVTLMHEVV